MSYSTYSELYDVFYDTDAIYTKEHRDSFNVGDLVTCTCHASVGLLLSISYIEDQLHPSIDIGHISWVIKRDEGMSNISHHSLARLRKLD